METTNVSIGRRVGQPYPCAVIAQLCGAPVCWWGSRPRGYWVWSRRCGREFFPLDDARDRSRLRVWLALRRRAEARALARAGVRV